VKMDTSVIHFIWLEHFHRVGFHNIFLFFDDLVLESSISMLG
jgi:hypothetical protein